MPYDFGARKILTYQGINATPVEPTATKAGNGSHLISQYNGAVDDIQRALDGLDSTLANLYDLSYSFVPRINELEFQVSLPRPVDWTIATENWSAVPGQRLIFSALPGQQTPITVSLNNLFRTPGKHVELINISDVDLNIRADGNNYKASPMPTRLYLSANSGQAIGLVWVSTEMGFIPTANGVLVEEN